MDEIIRRDLEDRKVNKELAKAGNAWKPFFINSSNLCMCEGQTLNRI